ncbi:MAG: hypothetical protein KDC27_06235 [Acidobacteria bacterium]|nr:hypothetical protein [Acidobacteriota bacterium]
MIRYTQLVHSWRVAMLALLATAAFAGSSGEQVTIRGHVVADKPVTLHSDETVKLIGEDGKTYALVVEADSYHTLHDPELAGRLWEIVGNPLEGGRFEVRQLFTIVDGVRHKVSYYCMICHIVSYRPGQCMCCQEKVDLREEVYSEQ